VRFESVLKHATRVVIASTQRLEIGGVSLDYANQLLLGLAKIRASQLDTKLSGLAVWDGGHGDGPGGTASVIERWRNTGLPVEIIDLAKLRSEFAKGSGAATPASSSSQRRPMCARQKFHRFGSQIMSMLFADTVGFSKLTEQEVRQFVQY